MDMLYMDKKMGDDEFGEFLDHDLFTPSPSGSVLTDNSDPLDFSLDNGMDHDWLDTLFDDPVLNDRMISDALQPNPHVQSEHSYSLANNEKAIDMTIKKEVEKDSDSEMLGTTVNPNSMTPTQTTTTIIKTESSPSYNPTSLQPTTSSNKSLTATLIQAANECSSNRSYTSSSTKDPCLAPSPPGGGLTSIITSTTTSSSHNSLLNSANTMSGFIKQEPLDAETTMVTVTRTMNPQTLLKPTIILATSQPNLHHHRQQTSGGSHISRQQERLVLPKVNVKVEPAYSFTSASNSAASSPDHLSYDQLSLPPTPPSSSTSDSEGCQSPDRSQPSSPVRGGYHHSHQPAIIHHPRRYSSPSPPPHAPFFMNPIPTSGILILSEEEKRTLISEGYPIPNKLPLTKGEEKNLKKIRRKIKNKISAQESRRKKKEYLESLERKVESYSQENMDLKKKMDSLENNNRSLMSQLQKLQGIVNKIRPQNSSQTGTCLMVLVLCFAVFLGTWSPMTWSIGYSSINATPGSMAPTLMPSDDLSYYRNPYQQPPPFGVAAPQGVVNVPAVGSGGGGAKRSSANNHGVVSNSAKSDKNGGGNIVDDAPTMGPEIKDATTDQYATKMKSRVLLSVRDEDDQHDIAYGPAPSFCLKDYITKWFSTARNMFPEPSQPKQKEEEGLVIDPPLPKVEVLDVETENNQTGEGRNINGNSKIQDQATMHPDMAVMTKVDTTA